MAIGFARIEFVSRSKGKDACCKAAYNSREKIANDNTGKVFNFSNRADSAYHEIILPEGVDNKYYKITNLWNEAEKRENRKNSQIAMELVLALPDNEEITLEDRIEITRELVKEEFVKEGLGVQIDIHEPHGEKENHNWHAHVLITTRQFAPDGERLGNKARDFMKEMGRGKYPIGEIWRTKQNRYFERRGLDLRVDEKGLIPQSHLGPIRMRIKQKARDILYESTNSTVQQNIFSGKEDSLKILDHLLESKSSFNKEEVERYIEKHVSSTLKDELSEEFWKQENLVPLYTEEGKFTGNYSSKKVKEEEAKIIRIAERMEGTNFEGITKTISKLFNSDISKIEKLDKKYKLTQEQNQVFKNVIGGRNLTGIKGRAGTGKSYVVKVIKEFYESSGYNVRGLAANSRVAKEMTQEQGFKNSDNVHKALFKHKNGREVFKNNDILVVEEAARLGNEVILELLRESWKHSSKIILIGDERQLGAVERGGMFEVLAKKYNFNQIDKVRRQKEEWQREVSFQLSHGEIYEALKMLESEKKIHYGSQKEEVMYQLICKWDQDHRSFPQDRQIIMAVSNREVKALNEMVRQVRIDKNELGNTEYEVESSKHGKIRVSEGDKIIFRQNNKEIGADNGMEGEIVSINEEKIKVKTTESNKEITFNPKQFSGYQLGYAVTISMAQGMSVDRSYVLHNPVSEQKLAYVGLTRQKYQVDYFVSVQEARNIKELSYQLSRDRKRENSCNYYTKRELAKLNQNLENGKAPNDENLWNKFYNYTRDRWSSNEKFYQVEQNSNNLGGYSVNLKEQISLKERGMSLETAKAFNEEITREESVLSNKEELINNTKSTILLVDSGEAELGAKQKFPEMLVMRYRSKNVDINCLKQKHIVIWPANDPQSINRAEEVGLKAKYKADAEVEIMEAERFPKNWHPGKEIPNGARFDDERRGFLWGEKLESAELTKDHETLDYWNKLRINEIGMEIHKFLGVKTPVEEVQKEFHKINDKSNNIKHKLEHEGTKKEISELVSRQFERIAAVSGEVINDHKLEFLKQLAEQVKSLDIDNKLQDHAVKAGETEQGKNDYILEKVLDKAWQITSEGRISLSEQNLQNLGKFAKELSQKLQQEYINDRELSEENQKQNQNSNQKENQKQFEKE